MKTKSLTLKNCMDCPNCVTTLTKGYGYAQDYKCSAAGYKTIAGYVEWDSEGPQDGEFPDFCPLPPGNNLKVKGPIGPIPAAACIRCGGWTQFGGMSQHAKTKVPVLNRVGCTCKGNR